MARSAPPISWNFDRPVSMRASSWSSCCFSPTVRVLTTAHLSFGNGAVGQATDLQRTAGQVGHAAEVLGMPEGFAAVIARRQHVDAGFARHDGAGDRQRPGLMLVIFIRAVLLEGESETQEPQPQDHTGRMIRAVGQLLTERAEGMG